MDFLLQLDGNILLAIQEYIRHDWMDSFWKFITSLGDYGLPPAADPPEDEKSRDYRYSGHSNRSAYYKRNT